MGEIATVSKSTSADFLLLGPLEARVDGRPVELGAALERRLLAAVLSSHPSPVPRPRLIQAVWDNEQPQDPVGAFDHLAMRVRKRLEAAGLPGVLRAEPGGYRLGAPEATVDVNEFRELVGQAHQRSGAGRTEQAAALLEAALGRFRGRPLDGLDGQWVDGYRHLLEEERHAAELSFTEVAIGLGRQRQQIPRLEALLQERPDDEYVTWLAMHAYYRAGRQIDAQGAFHRLRKELDERAATLSHRALVDLYQSMLSGDPVLMEPAALEFPVGRPMPSVAAASSSRPQQDSQEFQDSDEQPSEDDEASRTDYRQANVGRKVVSKQGGDGEFRFIEADQYVEIKNSTVPNLRIGNFHGDSGSEAERG